jgi:hypothetical protein
MKGDGKDLSKFRDIEFASPPSESSSFFIDASSSFSYRTALAIFVTLLILQILASSRSPRPSLLSDLFIPIPTPVSGKIAIFDIIIRDLLPGHRFATVTGSFVAADPRPSRLSIELSTPP